MSLDAESERRAGASLGQGALSPDTGDSKLEFWSRLAVGALLTPAIFLAVADMVVITGQVIRYRNLKRENEALRAKLKRG